MHHRISFSHKLTIAFFTDKTVSLWYGSSDVLLRLAGSLNGFPQTRQEYGFSPEWIRKCRRSFEGVGKILSQTLHLYIFSLFGVLQGELPSESELWLQLGEGKLGSTVVGLTASGKVAALFNHFIHSCTFLGVWVVWSFLMVLHEHFLGEAVEGEGSKIKKSELSWSCFSFRVTVFAVPSEPLRLLFISGCTSQFCVCCTNTSFRHSTSDLGLSTGTAVSSFNDNFFGFNDFLRIMLGVTVSVGSPTKTNIILTSLRKQYY